MIDPEALTPWFVLVGSACAALTGVVGVLFGLSVWWKNRGSGALRQWIHETAGAASVGRSVDLVKEEVTAVKNGLGSLETLRAQNHEDNQAALRRHDSELGALVTAQDRIGVAVKTLADEITAESEQRTAALTEVTTNLRDVAAIAAEAHAHSRSRKKHPTQARIA